MKTILIASLIAISGSLLSGCGGSSNSTPTGSQSAAAAVTSYIDQNTGIEAVGVCNGNPNSGSVGTISNVIDADGNSYYGAKSTEADHGGDHASNATVDCDLTINFGSNVQSADVVKISGDATGSWYDNYSQFYFYQSMHATADIYTLDASGQKTKIYPPDPSIIPEEIDPSCVGHTSSDPQNPATTCQFSLSTENIVSSLGANVTGVEFVMHFYTPTSASTCFTSCTSEIEPHIIGTTIIKAGTQIISSGI